jgi:hypothetical protein
LPRPRKAVRMGPVRFGIWDLVHSIPFKNAFASVGLSGTFGILRYFWYTVYSAGRRLQKVRAASRGNRRVFGRVMPQTRGIVIS